MSDLCWVFFFISACRLLTVTRTVRQQPLLRRSQAWRLAPVRELPLGLLLRSSKAVRKETMQMAARSGRPSPNPGFGSVVELRRGKLHGSFNLIGIGKTLASQRITAEEAPPALLWE